MIIRFCPDFLRRYYASILEVRERDDIDFLLLPTPYFLLPTPYFFCHLPPHSPEDQKYNRDHDYHHDYPRDNQVDVAVAVYELADCEHDT